MNENGTTRPSIAVVVLTHDRVHLLRQCVDNVLARVSPLTEEIVIVDNGSSDGTGEYLAALTDVRVTIVSNARNIGQNAYRPAFAATSSKYLIELDDDVVDAPSEWDKTLVEAFERVPDMGFLAANLVDNPNDVTARIMYGPSAGAYSFHNTAHGVRLKLGPVGGWCAITSRAIYDQVGGFRQDQRYVFWLEDAAYIRDVRKLGYEAAILDELKVAHAGGEFYAKVGAEKERYWEAYRRRSKRSRQVKRFLMRLPFVARLNARHRWFTPPK